MQCSLSLLINIAWVQPPSSKSGNEIAELKRQLAEKNRELDTLRSGVGVVSPTQQGYSLSWHLLSNHFHYHFLYAVMLLKILFIG